MLDALDTLGGVGTTSEIAATIGRSRVTVKDHVAALRWGGWITRHVDISDNRTVIWRTRR